MVKIKLTKEEKLALRQQLKKEKKLRIEEGKRQTKRDEIQREIVYSKLNKLKLEKLWTDTLLKIRIPELAKDYQISVNNIERLLDIKDFQISVLMDELDEANSQSFINAKRSFHNMDNLMRIYHEYLDTLKYKYENSLRESLVATYDDMLVNNTKKNENEETLNTMIFGLTQALKQMDANTQSYYLQLLREENRKNEISLSMMRDTLENKCRHLWTNLKEVLNEYLESTAETRKQYNILHEQEMALKDILHDYTARLWKLYEYHSKIKFLQSSDKEDLDLRSQHKMKEYKFFLNAFEAVKIKIQIDSQIDTNQMLLLVNESNDILKFLAQKRRKIEAILKIMSACRKHETREEKVLPYPELVPRTSNRKYEQKDAKSLQIKQMSAFWQKSAQGDALRYCLKEELKLLNFDNELLKKLYFRRCRT